MTDELKNRRERAAIDAYARAKAIGALAYDAWLAALNAYGDDDPAARRRLSEILSPSA